MKYNHKGNNVLENTGVDAFDVSMKAVDFFPESGKIDSEYIETLENSFSKRELAVLASMFIQEMNDKDDSSEEEINIEVVNFDKELLPQEILDFIKNKVKKGGILPFDSTCSCLKCTKLRAETNLDNKKFPQKIQGEGGDC